VGRQGGRGGSGGGGGGGGRGNVAAAREDVAAACPTPVARTRALGVEVEPRREKGTGGEAVAGRDGARRCSSAH